MKRRIDPSQLRAHAQRGAPRVPDALARYRSSLRRGEAGDDPFPRGRYCLDFELPRASDFCEMRVRDLYHALIPWLAHDLVERPQPWIDLIALVDELVEREDDWYAWSAPWPLADLRLVVDEVAGLLAEQPNPCARQWLGDIDYEHLGPKFAGLRQDLAAHAAEITEVLVNVHWW
ncbi:hypothetical protein OV203_32755 [Nannocystis sp. ILAH1]|uniref:hypothetical protein n=1 Tax=unclassified Nannocystis TaxID=2627009 RepID=UPI002271F641|nr:MULTISPECIES: hypothetical protein [unclassified Nannocystis]MCY0991954.1 hypothetical protein [Nannocystis sp. ILAH1]MCY1064204.1 hypothetical protein [Nannocystis sp. RBIL2]